MVDVYLRSKQCFEKENHTRSEEDRSCWTIKMGFEEQRRRMEGLGKKRWKGAGGIEDESLDAV